MKYYEIELEGETIKFRLTSNDCMVIEKTTGMSVLEYIQRMSVTTIVNLLKYMVRSSVPNYSEKDAMELYNKLIDNGYTISTIIEDIIMEALVVSGFMTSEELNKMKKVKE